MINYYFAGALTPNGFISYFEDIPDSNTDKLIIIKGTAGSGKSTLMKKIAEKYKKDFTVKCYKCYSCPNSLDGVKIQEKKIILLDGTAPHVVEASHANDTIFNMFDFIDTEKLLPYSDNIKDINIRISETKSRFNKYLKSCSFYLENITEYLSKCLNKDGIFSECEKLFESVKLGANKGNIKRMFLSSPSPQIPDNLISYNENYYDNYISVNSKFNVASKLLITNLYEKIMKENLRADVFFDYLEPDKVKYIYINGYFVSADDDEKASRKINLDKYFSSADFKIYSEIYKSDSLMFKKALLTAKKLLEESNAIHDELEKYYYTAIDFKALDKATEKLMQSFD